MEVSLTILTEELCLILCRRFRFMDEIVNILYYGSFREFVATFPHVPFFNQNTRLQF